MSSLLTMPAVALRNMTILPHTILHFDLSRVKSIAAVEEAMLGNQRIFLVTQKDPEVAEPDMDGLYDIGCIAIVKQVLKMPGGIVRVLVEGLERARLLTLDTEQLYLLAQVENLEECADCGGEKGDELKDRACAQQIRDLFEEYVSYFPKVGKAFMKQFESIKSLPRLIDEVTANLPVDYEKKQRVLLAVDSFERYEVLCSVLGEEIEAAKIRNDMAAHVKGKLEKNQKEYVLREQMNYIRKELGEDADSDKEAERYMDELDALEASDDIKAKIQKEIKRFRMLPPGSSETAVSRGYVETLLELPWDKMQEENRDLKNAEEILERDHYGLKKVKERMLEFLAVRNLTEKGESPIICLVGPPGCGKTSIARSIAEALNKKYVRVCLGGVRDEAEIRGHRRTYVGALPGMIVNGLKNAGVKNPLMLLDEIDKSSESYRGDTASALLEVLDSEQNKHFRDHYIELPVDLSEVLFIATANNAADIPRPLLDRMEIVEVSGYTENEKLHIARQHLMKKQYEKNGIKEEWLDISEEALKILINGYTREAGVRGLERVIGELSRKCARAVYEGRLEKMSVTAGNIEEYLGKIKYTRESVADKNQVGIVRGLAWTSVGGDTLEIEVNTMPGKGDIQLTGKLGEVMKESAMTALSYVRSIAADYGVKPEFFKENDFHLHIPEGATPKDGPSAGITMATALLSAVTGIPVRCDTAMTGEITLRGRVLPIGGLKEKLLAAKKAGVRQVLVPEKNVRDVKELEAEITEDLEIKYVSEMNEVLKLAMDRESETEQIV